VHESLESPAIETDGEIDLAASSESILPYRRLREEATPFASGSGTKSSSPKTTRR
jgi:hypothetical protein